MKPIRALATATMAAFALLAGAAGASAGPLEHFTYHEEDTNYRVCDNGLRLRTDSVRDGSVLVVEHGAGDWGYGLEHIDSTWTTTNLATGETFTGLNKGLLFKDQRLIANPDGTTTLLVNSPAEVVIWGPDGKVAFRAAGLAVYEFLITGDEGEYVGATVHGFDNLPHGACNTAAAFWL